MEGALRALRLGKAVLLRTVLLFVAITAVLLSVAQFATFESYVVDVRGRVVAWPTAAPTAACASTATPTPTATAASTATAKNAK